MLECSSKLMSNKVVCWLRDIALPHALSRERKTSSQEVILSFQLKENHNETYGFHSAEKWTMQDLKLFFTY